MAGIEISIISNRLGDIAAKLPGATRALVQKTGPEVVAGCQVRSRVDTGALRAGWAFRMTGETSGEVYNDVDHVLPNEYGTVHMPAQPMAHPAADAARPGFEAAAAKLAEGL
jgi:hypothetical protein